MAGYAERLERYLEAKENGDAKVTKLRNDDEEKVADEIDFPSAS